VPALFLIVVLGALAVIACVWARHSSRPSP